MSFVILALGLVLIVEGLVYALAPSLLKQMIELIAKLPDAVLRQNGLIALAFGLLLVWGAFQLGL